VVTLILGTALYMFVTLVVPMLIIYWVVKRFSSKPAFDIRKEWNASSGPSSRTAHPYELNATSDTVVTMKTPVRRPFTHQDECAAFAASQLLWIQYKDAHGNVTERVVEVYHPRNDEYIFTWCRLKQEPRTFLLHNIQQWQLLPETFQPNPLVAQYWEEEVTRTMGDNIPWHRWIERQPPQIGDHDQGGNPG